MSNLTLSISLPASVIVIAASNHHQIVAINPVDQAVRFINAARRVFQDKVDHRWEIFFSHGSDINAWCAVWRSQEHLNYLSFDQG